MEMSNENQVETLPRSEGGTPLLRAIANQAKRISTCLPLAADSRMASQMTALR